MKHRQGCRCAECLGVFDRRVSAARQFYQLLNLSWIGMRAATVYADYAREGIEEAFPPHAQVALSLLRKHNPELLASLLADILD